MTVGELIQELRMYNPELEVQLEFESNEYEIQEVKLVDYFGVYDGLVIK